MSEDEPQIAIHGLSIQGFKSIAHESHIEIRPLTILAGANSSGKSSIMQPLLLMKQTLGSSTDPGPLLLDGANVKFTSVDQFTPRGTSKNLRISITTDFDMAYSSEFAVDDTGDITIKETSIIDTEDRDRDPLRLLSTGEYEGPHLREAMFRFAPELAETLEHVFKSYYFQIVRRRCFLDVAIFGHNKNLLIESLYTRTASDAIGNIIHIPGLRGPRDRLYPKISHDPPFIGSFENYVGSIIFEWAKHKDNRLQKLEQWLAALGMTRAVIASRIDDTQFDVLIERLPENTAMESSDLVSIADVGFGVSQVLPMLVACLVGEPDQMVYIEQPELHLHPKAQYVLADILASAAAEKGMRLVVETHSAFFLLRIQTLVAKGAIDPRTVKLHWFSRDNYGNTSISSADLDRAGAFGDWPEDFGDVELMASAAYLDAIEDQS